VSFTQSQYLIPLIFTLVIIIIISIRFESSFFTWIKDHWFFKRRKRSVIASILYYLGLFLVGLALLDLRGPEEYITGKVSDQRTIILIDNSSSMMAEDVRPNRFEKGIVLAKHYVRKAVGQQISISVFSDSMKRIVPFTNDMDLVDARLNALKDMKLNRGGTALSLAIQESIQYFENTAEDKSGNILIFTDAEETDGGISLELPKGITVGVVGIGTAKGAPIPMRNRNNTFVGNKRYKGEVVITKLDEGFLKKLGEKVKNYKYWVAGSYSLPTEDIVNFFSRIHNIKQSENSFRIRPVLQNYLMIPGVILLALSFLLKNMKTFVYVGMLSILMLNPSFAQEEEPPKEKSQEITKLEEKFATGNMTKNEKRLLAQKLLQEGFAEQSEKLYGEILKNKPLSEETKDDYFNYGAAQFKSKQIGKGFQTYKKLHDHLSQNDEKNKDMLKSVKDNMLKAIQSSSQSKSGKSDDDDQKDQQDQKNQKGKGKGKDQKKDQKKGKGKGESEQDQKKDQDKKDKNKNKDKNDQKGDNKDKNNENDDQNKKDKKKDKNKGAGNGIDKKKLPAILKQLMSDDNKLQKKMIDTGTTKRKTREKRDW
jgi:Ca-activated chloride channel family protein